MRKRSWLILVIVLLVWSYFARPVYDFAWIAGGRVADMVSNRIADPLLRTDRQASIDRVIRQGEEIDAYLRARRGTPSDAQTRLGLDFTSGEAYAKSAEQLRSRLRESLRYPPPGWDAAAPGLTQETLLGDDEIASYLELRIPVTAGVHSAGYLLRPKGAPKDERLPLLIAAHGRGGMPEPTGDGNLAILSRSDRDFAWRALQRGYAVWLPTYVHYGTQGADFRDRLAVRAWQAGTSLPAIEIAKTIKALDAILQRPDVDPERVAMVGLSYGGFYTLYTTALEPRIRVAVVAAYFNDRGAILDNSEPHGFLDWRFQDSLSLWRDPTLVALVAPRPLLIEAGNQDQLFPIEGARRAAPEAARYYEKLGVPDRFRFLEFVGRHDYNGLEAMKFIDKHLQGPAVAVR